MNTVSGLWKTQLLSFLLLPHFQSFSSICSRRGRFEFWVKTFWGPFFDKGSMWLEVLLWLYSSLDLRHLTKRLLYTMGLCHSLFLYILNLFFLCASVPIWLCGIKFVWHCVSMALFNHSIMYLRHYFSVAVFPYGIISLWHYDSKAMFLRYCVFKALCL